MFLFSFFRGGRAPLLAPLCLALTTGLAASTYSDSFGYADGSALAGQGGWAQIGSTTTNPLTVTAGAVALAASGQDAGVDLGFAAGSGSLYAGFDLNLSAAQTGDYFFSFNTAATSTNYTGRFYAKAAGAGYVLGYLLGVSGATPVYSTTVLNFGTTYRIVVRYDFVAGPANDTGLFYVNPTSATESANLPAIALNAWAGTTAENATLGAVVLRQGSATSACTVAGLRQLVVSADFAAAAHVVVAGPPAVTSTTPAPGGTGAALAGGVTVAFDRPVTVAGPWFSITGSVSGAHPATVTGNGTTYTLAPAQPFTSNEQVTVTLFGNAVTDATTGTFNLAGDYSFQFTTFDTAPVPIHTVQGSGTASTSAGSALTVEGVVTASFQAVGGIGGYYVEAPEAEWDADSATPEGIYVFDNTNPVAVGDRVAVGGTVTEYGTAPNTQTELTGPVYFNRISSGNPLPAAVAVALPFASPTFAERYEGMLVALPQTLTVTDNYDLGHYGELILSNGRLATPTNVAAPGAPAAALAGANLLNQVLLDDASSTTYPDPTPFLTDSDPATATRRTGSTVTGLTGILDHRFGTYVIEPTAAPVWVDANPRTAAPRSSGSLRVAIGNVQNFMNGDGAGGAFPTPRGATTAAEYLRQKAKITAGILGLAPDIMGLTEVENDKVTNGSADSYGPAGAIQDLVDSLNAAAPAGTTYAFVNAAAVDIVTDQIHCAFIYRTQTVRLVGAPAMLNHAAFNSLARNPLAQTFQEVASGEKLTVCINHFRAKGSAATGAGNADSGDGQGTNNALRVQEANALDAWLATDPTGSGDPDFLIIGDLNSYAKEDPVAAIEAAGYTNLTERFEGAGGYSYSFNGEFGHLDHALASASLNRQVGSAATWHVNSDEPVYYDFNVENKSAAQQAVNAGTPSRYADHDPVVIGLSLAPAPAGTTFATWRQSHFSGADLTNDAVSGPAATAGFSGLTNLVLYALGLDPAANPATGLPMVAEAGSAYTYTYQIPTDRTDIVVGVEVSTDLVSWSPSAVPPALLQTANGVATWQAVASAAGTDRLFFRLVVTQS